MSRNVLQVPTTHKVARQLAQIVQPATAVPTMPLSHRLPAPPDTLHWVEQPSAPPALSVPSAPFLTPHPKSAPTGPTPT